MGLTSLLYFSIEHRVIRYTYRSGADKPAACEPRIRFFTSEARDSPVSYTPPHSSHPYPSVLTRNWICLTMSPGGIVTSICGCGRDDVEKRDQVQTWTTTLIFLPEWHEDSAFIEKNQETPLPHLQRRTIEPWCKDLSASSWHESLNCLSAVPNFLSPR